MNTSLKKVIVILSFFLLITAGTITEHNRYSKQPHVPLSKTHSISNLILEEAEFYGIHFNITAGNSPNEYKKIILIEHAQI